ncbi:RimJ/RimL family protein N-acetyltransferase [Aurantimicrobium minutum]|uniref:GNAT family N-acetyltransferase n=2 Tax=Aurantimicrobium minutum TaxID=708131 RepID=UPI002473C17E|nr:GNAT family N-acetyltransferase [Aurantimicrobium minutum]MDH6424023.1 RimJ/RimL family protein N-acetyltransferase [Aurantimicrobium minutum]
MSLMNNPSYSLRELLESDAVWIERAAEDVEIQKWTANGGQQVKERQAWAILKDTEPVGVISLHSVDLLTSVADVGYWVAPWGRRQGAAKAALGLVESELTQMHGVKSIQLRIMEGNHASIALATSLGYELVSAGTCSCGSQGVVPAVIYEKKL